MAINPNSVSAIKGDAIRGSLHIYDGIYTGTVEIDTDFEAAGFKELGLASSEEGVSVSISADNSAITAWGDRKLADIYSNSAATVTINLFSFGSSETLRALFGKKNVTVSDGLITVSMKGADAPEQNSLAILGVDRNGQAAVLFARIAAVDPNFEFTWNDADPVSIPAVFNLYKDDENSFGTLLLETEEEPAPEPDPEPGDDDEEEL